MSKADEIMEKWKNGEKQIKIASELDVSESYVSQILAPFKKKKIPPSVITPRTIVTIKKVPDDVKRLLKRIDRNLDKTWGYDNKMGREKGRPKYRNLWEDWNFFKDWFESLT